MQASFVIMAVYTALSLSGIASQTCKRGQSRVGVGLQGIVVVIVAVGCSLGLSSYFGIPFNPTSTQVLPFLALGLGVDDMFVLAHHFKGHAVKDSARSQRPQVKVSYTFRKAGVSITLTTVVNGLVFLVGSLTPIPAVTAFCIQSVLAVLSNYVLLMLTFPAVTT